jgi:hypothetical protein
MAIEIVDLPIKNGDLPSFFVNVYQVGYFFVFFSQEKTIPGRMIIVRYGRLGASSPVMVGMALGESNSFGMY